VLDNGGDGLFSIAALPDNLDILFGQQQTCEAFARKRFVVDNQCPDFLHGVPFLWPYGVLGVHHARAPVVPMVPMTDGLPRS
jgi:hypothetical protein